jgi:hypothetical protein
MTRRFKFQKRGVKDTPQSVLTGVEIKKGSGNHRSLLCQDAKPFEWNILSATFLK